MVDKKSGVSDNNNANVIFPQRSGISSALSQNGVKMRPIISVITVCYNALTKLKITAESVLAQDASDWEYIIVDGGSTDGTVGFLQNVAQKSISRAFCWRSQRDRGIYDAMNEGVKLASGDWIIFMNAGDVFFSPDIISRAKDLLHNLPDDVGVFYGDTLMHYQWGDVVQCDDELNNHNPVMPFIHQSAFTKRILLLKYPFDLSYRIIADFYLYYTLRNLHIPFVHHKLIISKYDVSEGLSATSPLQIALERAKFLSWDKSHFWLFRKMYIFVRAGSVFYLKILLPACIVNFIMKARRRYMKKIETYNRGDTQQGDQQ
ncbi:MAG: glycosyltransferase [Victivallaceae bacterium]|nr:glycosyltransferase [Victivallaceae bacterium]